MRISEFRPVAVENALAIVRTHHQLLDELSFAAGEDLLERVRKILLTTSDEGIPNTARSFRPVELKAILQILSLSENEDRQVLRRGSRVTRLRPRSDLLKYSWSLIKSRFPVAIVEHVCREMGKELNWGPLGNSRVARRRFEVWFGARSLPEGILKDFSERIATDKLEPWLQSHEIEKGSGLEVGIWEYALTAATARLINRLGHGALLEEAKKRPSGIQAQFGQNYLTKLKSRERWKSPILEWIKSKFEVPPRSELALNPFWRQIPAEVRLEYRRWVTEKTLAEFFSDMNDPNGRFAFWKEFLDDISEAEELLPGEAALIDFGSFGVVEFSYIGNAAYIYPASYLVSIRARTSRTYFGVYSLKDQDRTVQKRMGHYYWDGRIIHRGGWQWKYGPWIRTLIQTL